MSDQKAPLCPACDTPMVNVRAWLRRCPECRLLCSSLAPGGGRGVDGLEHLRRRNFAIVVARLRRHLKEPGRRLLEIGAAEGWFLEAASEAGFRAHGIEPCPVADPGPVSAAYTLETGFFPADLRDRGPYDVVVFNDAFEHFVDPARTIRDVAALVAGGGFLVINLPASTGVLYRIASGLDRLGIHAPFERLWQRGLPSPHMSYFTRENLTLLVTRYSSFVPVDCFSLPSLSRDGLRERIRSTHGGAMGAVLFAAAWALSFLVARLPPDIIVLMFQNRRGA